MRMRVNILVTAVFCVVALVGISRPSYAVSDRLLPNQTLHDGYYLQSANGKARLYMQTDGNLVLYFMLPRGPEQKAVWDIKKVGISDARASIWDGNLVVCDSRWNVYWSSGTAGHANSMIVLQNDGNLVIYDSSSRPIWSTNTTCYLDALGPKNGLGPDQTLHDGYYLESPNGQNRLYMQTDGNLVLKTYNSYMSAWKIKWAINKTGITNARASIWDGNLVVCDSNWNVYWSSGTPGHPFSVLVLLDNGKLVIYDQNRYPHWSDPGILLKISGISSPVGLQHWPGPMPGDLSVVANSAKTFGLLRIQFGSANATSEMNSIGAYANAAASQGAYLLALIPATPDPSSYAAFFRTVAGGLWQAGCRNVIFELMNEPSGDVQRYADFANAAASAIKSVSGFAVCTGGVRDPIRRDLSRDQDRWAADMITRIDWRYFDFFGYHCYQETSDIRPESVDGIELDSCINYMRELLAASAPRDRSVDVLMTEMSWKSDDTEGTDLDRAAYFARLALQHLGCGVESNIWFPAPDRLIPSLAYDIADKLRSDFPANPKEFPRSDMAGVFLSANGRPYLSIEYNYGKAAIAIVWKAEYGAGGSEPSQLYITGGGYQSAAYVDLAQPLANPRPLTFVGGHLQNSTGNLTISGMPIIIYLYRTAPNNPPNTPLNLLPANSSTGISLTPTLVASAFSDPDAGDTHAASEWMVCNSDGTLLWDPGATTTNITSITIPSGVLQLATTYRWRVCYQDNHGAWSGWSATFVFTTASAPSSPPAAPTSLTAAPYSVSEIRLAWRDNSTDETGFRIERRTGSTGSYSEIATVGANLTSYASGGLNAGTTYYYRVRAYNDGGNSTYSNSAYATTLATALAAPSNLTATAVSTSQINLTWTDNSTNESGFRIYRKKGATGTWALIKTTGVNVTSFNNTGLIYGTLYYYRVRAYNSLGNSSYSNEANARTLYPVANPTNLTAAAISSSRIDLTWTDNSTNESGFKIDRKKGATGTWALIKTTGANITAFSSTGLSASSLYYYRVRAYNGQGNSAYSNEASATTLPIGVSLHAQIQGPAAGNLAASILVKIYSPGGSGTPLYSQTVTLDSNGQGYFRPTSLASGTYDVWGKVGTHLAKRIRSWAYNSSASSLLEFGTLLAGDLNNDNVISQPDVDYLNSVWGTSNSTGDINRDGVVNGVDFAVLNGNWGLTGDR